MTKRVRRRFTGSNGEFKPSVVPPEGTLTVKYLKELLEWVFYNDAIIIDQKRRDIEFLEEMVESLLKERGISYIKKWSPKLNDKDHEVKKM